QNDTAMNTTPSQPVSERLAAAVEANSEEIVGLSRRIHANPEPGMEERQAAAAVAEILARHGFEVERPAGSLETAVRARLAGGAGSGPRVASLAGDDALG